MGITGVGKGHLPHRDIQLHRVRLMTSPQESGTVLGFLLLLPEKGEAPTGPRQSQREAGGPQMRSWHQHIGEPCTPLGGDLGSHLQPKLVPPPSALCPLSPAQALSALATR